MTKVAWALQRGGAPLKHRLLKAIEALHVCGALEGGTGNRERLTLTYDRQRRASEVEEHHGGEAGASDIAKGIDIQDFAPCYEAVQVPKNLTGFGSIWRRFPRWMFTSDGSTCVEGWRHACEVASNIIGQVLLACMLNSGAVNRSTVAARAEGRGTARPNVCARRRSAKLYRSGGRAAQGNIHG